MHPNSKEGSIVAKEISIGSSVVGFQELLTARTNLLGPVEHLSLSSGGTPPEESQRVRKKPVIVRNARRQPPQRKAIKNAIKLEPQ